MFRTDGDRFQYLLGVALAMEKFDARCLTYCLMPNHIHLLAETTRPNLPSLMRDLHGEYAVYFNREYGRVGHAFATRYVSNRAEDEGTACWFATYVANNPVKHGFCSTPDEWEWSSHRATLGLERAPSWLAVERLMELFDGSVDRYIELVALGRAGGPDAVVAALQASHAPTSVGRSG